MNRIVGEVVRKLRGEHDAEVQMEVIAGAGLWPILIDSAKFEIALAELVRNACDAMDGGGRLTVETVNIRLTREFVARCKSSGFWNGSTCRKSPPGRCNRCT